MGFFSVGSDALAAAFSGGATSGNDGFIGINSQYFYALAAAYAAESVSESVDASTPGANPDIVNFKSLNFHLSSSPHREYHYRFIAVPNPLVVNNPQYNSNIPWHLWNTFPNPDSVVLATITGTSVVTSPDFGVAVNIYDFEWAEYNIQIAPGESTIDADLTGTYTQGSFVLDIIGNLVIDLYLLPETVSETWTWVTSVNTAWDSTEQRVRHMPGPKRNFEMSFKTDRDLFLEFAYRLHLSVIGTMAVPYYQYGTRLTADSPAGTNQLYFNVDYANLQVGDQVYIKFEKTDDSTAVILEVASFTVNGCLVTGTTPSDLRKGMIICPMFVAYLDDPSQNFNSYTGTMNLRGQVVDRTRFLERDLSAATLDTFNSKPVMNRSQLANATEKPTTRFDQFDSGFGAQNRVSSWPYQKFERGVRGFSPLKGDLAEFDWWMLFFDTVAGSHKPFYLPSQMPDLLVATPPTDGSSTLLIYGNRYASAYLGNPIYAQIEIEFADGTILWYDVDDAITQSDGNDLLYLGSTLPLNVETNTISVVRYLYQVRLATDEVRVEFRNNRVYFSFSVMGTAN